MRDEIQDRLDGRFAAAGEFLLLQGAPSASAAGAGPGGPYQVKDLRVVSGPSPFAAGCPGPHDDQAITGHELESAITVNPADPRNIVATWKQDVGPSTESTVATAR